MSDLRKLAETATAGPWMRGAETTLGAYVYRGDEAEGVVIAHAFSDSHYIAAASPDMILALLDALEFVNRTLDPSHPAAEHVQRALERP